MKEQVAAKANREHFDAEQASHQLMLRSCSAVLLRAKHRRKKERLASEW